MKGKKEKDAKPLDPVRRRLTRLLKAKGSTMTTASLAMGRNAAYLQQFIHRGIPKILAEDDREILAEHLGCGPELLKHGRSYRPSTHARRRPPSDTCAARRGYSVVPEADVRLEPGAEAWNSDLRETGEGWLFADSFIRHRLQADPGDLWMIEADGDSMEQLLSTGDHFMLGRHRVGREADRARAALRPVPRDPQVAQPRVRRSRVRRQKCPCRRTGRLGLQEAVGGAPPFPRLAEPHRMRRCGVLPVTFGCWMFPPRGRLPGFTEYWPREVES